MNLNQATNQTNTITKGAYITVVAQTVKGIYTKVYTIVCRLGIAYENINGVECKHQQQPWKKYINDCIFQNTNNGEYYIQLYLTNNHKATNQKYYCNGVEITKEQYDQANPPKPNQKAPSVVFTKNIKDIISIG